MNQMQLLPSRFLLFLLILVAGLLVFINLDSLWSQSVDLAHHYALTYRISEQFHLVSLNDPTLGEMNYYPRLSHIFAATIGWPLNSNLLGIQTVSLLSLAAIWGGFVYILNTLPKPFGFLSTILLAVLLFLNKSLLKFEVHGAEITSNFFYSQLVAQGVIVLAIAGAIFLEARKSRAAAYVFLIGVITVNTGVHLLPALELLGLLGAMVVFNLYLDRAEKKSPLVLVTTLAIPVIALCGVVLNPAFSAVRKIAENDGYLAFGHISYPFGLGLICIVALLASVVLLILHVRSKEWFSHNAIKYLALYGVSIAGLCLLQMVLLKFGYGSNYAVKKYGFGVISYLFIAAAMGLGWCATLVVPPKMASLRHSGVDTLAVAACFFVIFKSSVMPSQVLDLSELLQLEKNLTQSVNTELPDIPGKPNVIIGLDGRHSTFNYMFSLALVKTPRDLAIPDVLLANELNDYFNYGYVISSVGSGMYDMSKCQLSRRAGISINSAKCIEQELKDVGFCKNTVDFSTAGFFDRKQMTGFDKTEPSGSWMTGKIATYTCEVPSKPRTHLELDLSPFLAASLRSQTLKILINGETVLDQQVQAVPDKPLEVDLPATAPSGRMVITFVTPDAASPKQLGVSEDTRTLSFFLKSMKFY